MEKFWTREVNDSSSNHQTGTLDAGAGDDQGAQFCFRIHAHKVAARKLKGYLQFPQRTEASIFHGSLTQLKKLCLKNGPRQVLHDKRFEHWT